MGESLTVAQKIAGYLRENNITIVPGRRADGTETLSFIWYRDTEIIDLGEIIYDGRTGMTYPVDVDNLRRSLQLPEFVTKVRRPLARLLRQVSGDFYAKQLKPIHDACDAVEAYSMQGKIKPEYKRILDKIRELYIKSGGEPLYKPEDFGFSEFSKSITGEIEVDFDYGIPQRMYTPDGSCVILGDSIAGDTKKFWDLFTREFYVEILEPQRERARSELELQLSYSGPCVIIRERD